MKIAVAQINCTVGDLAGNAAKILAYAERAKQQGAALLLTPELALCGYPPEDLLLRAGFYSHATGRLHELAARCSGITVVVGHPHEARGRALQRRLGAARRRDHGDLSQAGLPNYAVFDEERYFDAGRQPACSRCDGVKFALGICADIWAGTAPRSARMRAGAQVLLVLNASPYHIDKQTTRYEAVRERVAETGLPVMYANMVGGQDELVFDGASFALDAQGELTHSFRLSRGAGAWWKCVTAMPLAGEIAPAMPQEESLYRALCWGCATMSARTVFPA